MKPNHDYMRAVVEQQCEVFGNQNGTRRILCPDFSSICYNKGPCSLCGGRGWVTSSYKV